MVPADEYPGPGAGVVTRGLAGVLERFPGALHEKTLLRIQDRALTRRDPEECGVEFPSDPR